MMEGLAVRAKVALFFLGLAAVVMLVAAVPEWFARLQLERKDVAFDERTLFERVEKGDVEAVTLLLRAGIDADAMNERRYTGMMIAARRGDVAMVRAFIEGGADLDYHGPLHIGIPFLSSEPPRPESVPLVIAADAGHLEVVELLLEHGAHKKNAHDATVAMAAAVHAGRAEVIELLRNRGVSAEVRHRWDSDRPGPPHLLREAVAQGKLDIVRALLPGISKLDETAPDGFRLLTLAARKGHDGIVQALLAARANPDALSREELAALVVAARSGRSEGVKALVEPTAVLTDPTAAESLRAAALAAAPPTRALLETLGIPADEARDLALLAAAARGDIAETRELLVAGGNPMLRDWDDQSGLEYAALAGHEEIVRALVEAGGPAQAMNGRHHLVAGGTGAPRHQAIRDLLGAGRPARAEPDFSLEEIVNRPVDGRGGRARTLKQVQDRADANPASALIDAAGLPDPRTAAEILRRGTNVDEIDDRGVTALLHAVDRRSYETAHFLIVSKADVNARGANHGMTALMFACIHGQLEMVRLLVDARAEVNAEDARGLTPLRFATDWKRLQTRIGDRLRYAAVISLLRAHGARDR
jgi:ankyrin repeat protein